MTSNILISVVICAHNESKLLSQCLDGLSNQTFPAKYYELLIIDDGSKDETYNIAWEKLNNNRSIVCQAKLIKLKHGGLSVARNVGIRESKAKIIAFIDGDAVPDKNWLTELMRCFELGADYVGGRINLLEGGSKIQEYLQLTRHRQFFGPDIYNDQCIGCNMAFRRTMFTIYGGFYENFISRGDETTLLKQMHGNHSYRGAPQAVVYHERPNTLWSAFKVNVKSASLLRLTLRASKTKFTAKMAIVLLEQAMISIIPLLMLLAAIFPISQIFLIVSVTVFFRRAYFRKLNKKILVGLFEEYNAGCAIVVHIVFIYFYCLSNTIGNMQSLLGGNIEELRPPHSSPTSIISIEEYDYIE